MNVPPLDIPIETRGLGYAIYNYMSKYTDRIAQVVFLIMLEVKVFELEF